MTQEEKSGRKVAEIQRFLIFALIFVMIIWAVFGLALGVMHSPTNDMYPRIDAGDLVLYYRLDKKPSAHEAVVYEHEKNTLIGRVVASEGDVVEITEDGELIINGHIAVEKGIFGPTPRYEGGISYPVTVGKDEYFVLADVREGGMDSRYFGPLSKKEIQGTVISIFRHNNI